MGGQPSTPRQDLEIVPANRARWDDIAAIFGNRGVGRICWCQRYKLEPREAFASFPPVERAFRMRCQTDAGNAAADQTSGLVGYLGGEPVAWCVVVPRPAYTGLVRVYRVPWEGRQEDRSDPSVWAITCIFVRAGFRKRGISRAMAAAAVEFARDRGAHALEAYPMTTSKAIPEELHVGTVATFAQAGMREIGRPSTRRAVMRIDFVPSEPHEKI